MMSAMTPPTQPSTSDDGTPLFGATGVEGLLDTSPIDIAMMDTRTRESVVVRFDSYKDPGSGPVLQLLRSTKETQLTAAAALLDAAFIDHDGTPVEDLVGVHVVDDDLIEEQREAFPDRAFVPLSELSSRARWLFYTQAARYRIAGEVVVDIAQHVARQAMTPTPTVRPSPSPRGRTPARSGSKGSRSTKG